MIHAAEKINRMYIDDAIDKVLEMRLRRALGHRRNKSYTPTMFLDDKVARRVLREYNTNKTDASLMNY